MTRDLLLVGVSLFAWGVGEGTFIYFQAIALQRFGADPAAIGSILAVMGVLMAVAQAPAGALSDRIGSRPVMWSSWLLGSAAAWIMALARSLPLFVVGLMAYGLTSFVVAPMNAYATSVRGKLSVARALTIISAMYNLGAVAGPLIGGWIGERYGLPAVYTLAAGIFMLSTAIILFARQAPPESHHETAARNPVLRNRRFLALLGIIFVATFAIFLPQPLSSIFLQDERGISLSAIGQLGSIGSLGHALITLGLGRLSAPLGFAAGQALVGLFALALWRGTGFGWYALGYFFLGGYRLCRSMVLALVRPLVHSADTGFAYGMVETVNAAAVFAAPLAAGLLYDRDPALMYPAAIAAIAISLLLTAWTLFIRRRHEPEKQPEAEIVR
jgi:predicted MFS family arabinose efflux permease